MRILAILCGVFLIAGCVPTNKVVYLQDDTFELENAPLDQVVKSHQLSAYKYTLRAEDIVSIKITSLTPEEFNVFLDPNEVNVEDPVLTGYLIDQKGEIELPVIGKMSLQGLTIEEAEVKIRDAVANYVRDPTVKVKLLSFFFTVLGEVTSPGEYRTYNPKINFFQAIGMAGDMTDFANKSRIQIVRYEQDQAAVGYVNVLQDEFLKSPYFYLQPNDLIIIAPLKAKNVRQYQLANYSLILSTLTVISLLLIRL